MRGHILHGPARFPSQQAKQFQTEVGAVHSRKRVRPAARSSKASLALLSSGFPRFRPADKSQGRGKTIRLQTEACTLWSARLASALRDDAERWVLTLGGRQQLPATILIATITRPWCGRHLLPRCPILLTKIRSTVVNSNASGMSHVCFRMIQTL